mgnify:CR=1 FL=1
MIPVAEQQYNERLALLEDAHKQALDAFNSASKEDEVNCLKNLTLAYRSLKKHQAETVKTVCLTKHIERTQQRRDEQRINWNE